MRGLMLVFALAFAAPVLAAATEGKRRPMIAKATAVLFVEKIEKSLPFFETAGFKRAAEVPEGSGLGFVILQNGTAEVMLQSFASAIGDVKTIDPKDIKSSLTYLFIEVEDLAVLERALKPYKIVIPRRVTPYGATEIGYREPSGHFVTFAQFARKD